MDGQGGLAVAFCSVWGSAVEIRLCCGMERRRRPPSGLFIVAAAIRRYHDARGRARDAKTPRRASGRDGNVVLSCVASHVVAPMGGPDRSTSRARQGCAGAVRPAEALPQPQDSQLVHSTTGIAKRRMHRAGETGRRSSEVKLALSKRILKLSPGRWADWRRRT